MHDNAYTIKIITAKNAYSIKMITIQRRLQHKDDYNTKKDDL